MVENLLPQYEVETMVLNIKLINVALMKVIFNYYCKDIGKYSTFYVVLL